MKDSTRFIASARRSDNTNGDVEISDSREMAKSMARLLVMTRDLCHQSLNCCWQSDTSEFAGLHSLFEQHYQALRKAIDTLSDRIVELGFELPDRSSKPVWSPRQSNSGLKNDMLANMAWKHRICAREAQKLALLADDAGDVVSNHLASQRQAVHEKSAWFLNAVIETASSTHSLM